MPAPRRAQPCSPIRVPYPRMQGEDDEDSRSEFNELALVDMGVSLTRGTR